MFYLYSVPGVTFSSTFCMQLLFYMFFTLMSLKDRLRLKLKVKTKISLCMAINAGQPMANPYIHSTTVLCDRDCHGWSSIIAIHKEMSVFTFSFNFKGHQGGEQVKK